MSRPAMEISIWGSHTVAEALGSRLARVHEIYVTSRDGATAEIAALGREKGIRVTEISREKLASRFATEKHQNVAARVSLDLYESVEEWWEERNPPEPVTLLLSDGIQDPQNLGSLLRSAHFFGADLFVITKDRAAPLSGVVAKASSGALFSLPLARVTNLARELENLEDRGVFRVALDAEGDQTLRGLDLGERSVALVVGGEGEGIRQLTFKRCDARARLTLTGERDSLNAAVAGAVALYELRAGRKKS
ncbi:MAG: 23S rRNA (guanosine(2251)-2'-O)-methyltransferase RlmB [Pseudomonadota bacterium]